MTENGFVAAFFFFWIGTIERFVPCYSNRVVVCCVVIDTLIVAHNVSSIVGGKTRR
jgi:hypothetical protein